MSALIQARIPACGLQGSGFCFRSEVNIVLSHFLNSSRFSGFRSLGFEVWNSWFTVPAWIDM